MESGRSRASSWQQPQLTVAIGAHASTSAKAWLTQAATGLPANRKVDPPPSEHLTFCTVATPSPNSPIPNTYLLPAACQVGPHPAPGIISAHDCRRHSHPQARTWLVPVSYVSRTCLVRGGSPLRRKMASFGHFQPPGLLWPFGWVILAGFPAVPFWPACRSGGCSGACRYRPHR